MTSGDYTIEPGRSGKILILQSAWNNQLVKLMRTEGITELELNYAKGFIGKDLSFLEQLPELRVLLLTHRTIEDISPIHNLHNLLILEVNTYCRTPIDFNQFPNLEECALEWRAKAKSIFSRITLRKLFINSYSGKDMQAFVSLSNLGSLRLANSAVKNLEGIGALKSLVFLGLYNLKKLEGLAEIEALTSLEHLEVNGCRNIKSIEPIAALKNLKKLHLTDNAHIESLSPISELKNLEEVLFYDSTNVVDGNLSPLVHLPRLKNVSFRDRLHYSLTLDEVQASLVTP